MLSRVEIKDMNFVNDEKKNTVYYRIEDFPDHIDKIFPDEIFVVNKVAAVTDFNKASIIVNENGMTVSIFHAGKLLTDEIQKVANHFGLEGYNPKEISVQQWLDIAAIKQKFEEKQKAEQESAVGTKRVQEDGSVMFVEQDDDGSITFEEE